MFEPGDFKNYKKYGLTKKEATFHILSNVIELINDVKRDDNVSESDLDTVIDMIDESRIMLKEYIEEKEEKDDIIITNISKAMKEYTDSVVGVVRSYGNAQKILRDTIELIKQR